MLNCNPFIFFIFFIFCNLDTGKWTRPHQIPSWLGDHSDTVRFGAFAGSANVSGLQPIQGKSFQAGQPEDKPLRLFEIHRQIGPISTNFYPKALSAAAVEQRW